MGKHRYAIKSVESAKHSILPVSKKDNTITSNKSKIIRENHLLAETKKYNTPVGSQTSLYKDSFPSHITRKVPKQNVVTTETMKITNPQQVETCNVKLPEDRTKPSKSLEACSESVKLNEQTSTSKGKALPDRGTNLKNTEFKKFDPLKKSNSTSECYPEDYNSIDKIHIRKGNVYRRKRRLRMKKGSPQYRHSRCRVHSCYQNNMGENLQKYIGSLINNGSIQKEFLRNVKAETVVSKSFNKNLVFQPLPDCTIKPELTVQKLPDVNILQMRSVPESTFQNINVGLFSYNHEEIVTEILSTENSIDSEISENHIGDNSEMKNVRCVEDTVKTKVSKQDGQVALSRVNRNLSKKKIVESKEPVDLKKAKEWFDIGKKTGAKPKKGVSFYTPDNKSHLYNPDSPVSHDLIENEQAKITSESRNLGRRLEGTLTDVICKLRKQMGVLNVMRKSCDEDNINTCPHLIPCYTLQGKELGHVMSLLIKKHKSECRKKHKEESIEELIEALERIRSLPGMTKRVSTSIQQHNNFGFSGIVFSSTIPSEHEEESSQTLQNQSEEEANTHNSDYETMLVVEEKVVDKMSGDRKSDEEPEPEYEDDWEEDDENEGGSNPGNTEKEDDDVNNEKLDSEEGDQVHTDENILNGLNNDVPLADGNGTDTVGEDVQDPVSPPENVSSTKQDSSSTSESTHLHNIMRKLKELSVETTVGKEESRNTILTTYTQQNTLQSSTPESHEIPTKADGVSTGAIYEISFANNDINPGLVSKTSVNATLQNQASSMHQESAEFHPELERVPVLHTSQLHNLDSVRKTPEIRPTFRPYMIPEEPLRPDNLYVPYSYIPNPTEYRPPDPYFLSHHNSFMQPLITPAPNEFRDETYRNANVPLSLPLQLTSGNLIFEPLTPSFYRLLAPGLAHSLPDSLIQSRLSTRNATEQTHHLHMDSLSGDMLQSKNLELPDESTRGSRVHHRVAMQQEESESYVDKLRQSSEISNVSLNSSYVRNDQKQPLLTHNAVSTQNTVAVSSTSLHNDNTRDDFRPQNIISGNVSTHVNDSSQNAQTLKLTKKPLNNKYVQVTPGEGEELSGYVKPVTDKETQVSFKINQRSKQRGEYNKMASSSSTMEPLSSSSTTTEHMLSDASEGEVRCRCIGRHSVFCQHYIHSVHVFGEKSDCDCSDGEFVYCPHKFYYLCNSRVGN